MNIKSMNRYDLKDQIEIYNKKIREIKNELKLRKLPEKNKNELDFIKFIFIFF